VRILVVDVGGTNLKISIGPRRKATKVPSGPAMTAAQMAAAVKECVGGRAYDAVSIGYPGPVVDGRPSLEPKNLGGGWIRYDYKASFGKPVRIVNDAVMQALGSYEGGRMLFLGLGTGLGSALVLDGLVAPLEIAHLPYHEGGTYEDYVGLRGFKRMGPKRWEKHVENVVAILKQALQVDYVMLGGGQSRKLEALPAGARLGTNKHAILGGVRLWSPKHRRNRFPQAS
jgi:polyphosphate glucokinase